MKKSEAKENLPFLSLFSQSQFIIGVCLYFIGWIYIYYLYDNFGIPLSSVDIPFYYFFIYSYSAIMNRFSIIVLILFFAISILIFTFYKKNWIIFPVSIFLFLILFLLAQRQANQQAFLLRDGNARTIKFYLKGEQFNFYPEQFIKANKDEELKLFSKTKDKYFVFFQPKDEKPSKRLGFAYVYEVPINEKVLAEIEIQ